MGVYPYSGYLGGEGSEMIFVSIALFLLCFWLVFVFIYAFVAFIGLFFSFRGGDRL